MLVFTANTALGKIFATIITGICAILGQHAVRSPLCAVICRAHWYLSRVNTRLDRLIARWHANTLPKPRATGTPMPPMGLSQGDIPPPQSAMPAAPTEPRLPTRQAWLIRLVQPTAQFIGHIEALLVHPDIIALVAAAPQAGRLLRPLCRAYGLTPPQYLRLPDRAPKRRARPTRAPPGARQPATPSRPLPRYVRAAARHWRAKTA